MTIVTRPHDPSFSPWFLVTLLSPRTAEVDNITNPATLEVTCRLVTIPEYSITLHNRVLFGAGYQSRCSVLGVDP